MLGSADRNTITTAGGRVRAGHDRAQRQRRARAALAAAAARPLASRGRSVIIVMPADHDFILASSIPVAGLAFSRPHGPRVRSVHVALRVAGRLVTSADINVYAGRFAGVLPLDAPIDRADAELRVSDAVSPSTPAGVRLLTVQTPARTTEP